MNAFLNKYSSLIMSIILSFSLSLLLGHIVGFYSGVIPQKDVSHRCHPDSLEVTCKGNFVYPQVSENDMEYSILKPPVKPSLGYIRKPSQAVNIANAVISQEYGIPCSMGLDKYELYLCDDLWIVSGCVNINGNDTIVTVEIDKTTGHIWRVDKYAK